MGGRAAEALVFDGEVSTGASDDLQRATQIALEMVTRYGMNETVGQRTYAPPPPQPFLAGVAADHIDASDTTEREIDVAVRDLVAKAFGRATDILRSRRADLDEGARLLLAKETLTADQFPAIRSTAAAGKAGGVTWRRAAPHRNGGSSKLRSLRECSVSCWLCNRLIAAMPICRCSAIARS